MNKKALRVSDSIMIFVFFLIIGIPITIAMFVFYSNQADVRYEESKILAEKLINGVIINNDLNNDIFNENFDILKESRIDRNIINNGEFFFKIEVIEIGKDEGKIFQGGNRDFEVYCDLESEKFPKCFKEGIIVDNYRIRVLTGSNQKGEDF